MSQAKGPGFCQGPSSLRGTDAATQYCVVRPVSPVVPVVPVVRAVPVVPVVPVLPVEPPLGATFSLTR
jgi:hypothetical protein